MFPDGHLEKIMVSCDSRLQFVRKVDGWQTLATKPTNQPIDLAA